MTEFDVDMAIHQIAQGVDDLLAAARQTEARGHLAANRERLLAEMTRLTDGLSTLREPGAAGIVGRRLAATAVPGRVAARGQSLPAAAALRRAGKGGARAEARSHAG